MGSNRKALLISTTTLLIQPSLDKPAEQSFKAALRTPQMSGILPGTRRAALPRVTMTLGLFAACLWEEKKKKNLIGIHSLLWCPEIGPAPSPSPR